MQLRFSFCIAALFLLGSCTSGKGSKQAEEPVSDSGKAGSNKADDDSNIDVDKDFVQFNVSLSNEILSGRSIDRSDAEGLVRNLEATVKSEPNRANYLALLSAKRISGQSYQSIIDSAGRLADVEMRKDIDRSIPSIAKLEIAISAVRAKNFSMAEHFLPNLLESKVPDVKAGAYTLVGIMNYMDGKVPEAVESWMRARKEKDRYQAATYNLAVVSLKFGAHKFADAMLKDLDENWLVLTAKASVDRLSNNGKGASDTCQRALDARKNRLTLFNCALVEYQPNENLEKAKQMLGEASSQRGGGAALDKKIFAMVDKISKSRSVRNSSPGSDKVEKDSKTEKKN